MLTNASAIVLAGGRSARMGRSKALLPFGGQPLVRHIVEVLRPLFSDVIVVASREQELPLLAARVVRDSVPNQGPARGIYDGLAAISEGMAFVTSCDAAFLNLSLVGHLVSRAGVFDVVVPSWDGRYQPLHAVYRVSVLPALADLLRRGELRPRFLFDLVSTCTVGPEEIRRFDPQGTSFANLNTPADYAAAVARLALAG